MDRELSKTRQNFEKLETGKLWLEDFSNPGKLTVQVLVSEEISSMCKLG
ncbi:MAG: hypothetical protein PHF18_07680 [Methanosarcina sp.]|nr:hypothetical protein [Methanosarcina sp.]MDD3246713.1 hypothetical protein [Methanosarcina sp.]MDD4249187.1 hypothetical protein [Methanosarcina sp.]